MKCSSLPCELIIPPVSCSSLAHSLRHPPQIYNAVKRAPAVTQAAASAPPPPVQPAAPPPPRPASPVAQAPISSPLPPPVFERTFAAQVTEAPEHIIEPQIHGLQGVTVFKEETSDSITSAPSPPLPPPSAAEARPQSAQPAKDQGQKRKFVPRERAVPSNSVSRALGFAGLGASLLLGTAKDSVSRAWRGKEEKEHNVYSSFLSESNAERLAEALCRMRGAALKLGQMLSIQDETIMPPQFQAALERVRAGADVMPRRQLEKMLVSELGPDWRDRVAEFEDQPMAAASIGQVHGARTLDGRRVVMKVQYPGVAKSIESDVGEYKERSLDGKS